ncbi:GerW family sporulation protein [Desulfotomaculum copahuensis]|uniref:Sporulation protein YtfJ n=1 Tax=Desulfotomaculum copahuensis TaxID=1838280 RepID=A0A1B7LIQ4_9FIRM|nr:GerW family sporulation protein [Desulfotomaculum copahuensis]OAT86444.1 sporulation protein YtfJ [Desulfotomaculum copahuensis]
MPEHPIEGLMKTAMESIKQMTDVNTVVGDPVETPDGTVIIPISRVACGFGAGGGELEPQQAGVTEQTPFFGGGSGAGVSVQPVGFLVVGKGQIRMLPVDGNMLVDRLVDLAPQLISQLESLFKGDGRRQPAMMPPPPPPPPQATIPPL